MITPRAAHERGHANHGWLDSYHSFSFANYYDPAHMGFSVLRVINDDKIAPAQGFGTHGHRDMEIITYVLSGELAHKDSMGNGSTIKAGDVQRMSAGRGVTHSEFNASAREPVHLLQIWLMPDKNGITPGYAEKNFSVAERSGKWCLLVSNDGRDGSLTMQQNASLYAALLDGNQALSQPIGFNRKAYLHVARGECSVNGHLLKAGDALKFTQESNIEVAHANQAELLLFDLPN
ncbi:MAG: hypothetical protein RLZZ502_423 [Pseudomonadota bacterium]|jgi:redox-sensitive bicupin YhaK (pirin superfamily)